MRDDPMPDAATVEAARAGDARALDVLVGAYLPLVYNIIGRALQTPAEVDDVVQEVMLQMVRDLGQLRDPVAFRSWLVAIAMRQIRGHWRQRRSAPEAVPIEDVAVPDPGADFVDLAISGLRLSDQRREVVAATRWLDAEDRELLTLWWLETAGKLSRAEVAAAMDSNPPRVAVLVHRTKARLDSARGVVRALETRPRCPDLATLCAAWNGRPADMWRKRIARHVRECSRCDLLRADMLPAENLLAELGMLPAPLALCAAISSPNVVAPSAVRAGWARSGGPARRAAHGAARHGHGIARRATLPSGTKVAIVVAAVLMVVASVGIQRLVRGSDLPIRAAFYYPWYPENFTSPGSHYTPSAGDYSVDDAATVDRQIEDMQYGGLQAGIVSWWGQGLREDKRMPLLMTEAAKLGFSWTVYYEKQGYGEPSVSEITNDLLYLRRYSAQKAWLHIGNRPVIFVYGNPADNCATAARWAEANQVAHYYVVLKVFPGYRSCADQPQGWHQYVDVLEDFQAGYSAMASPGSWKYNQSTPQEPRDPARFRQEVTAVARSGAPFQLIVSYNEWSAGTAIESGTAWASPSGHGVYMDILHQVFAQYPR